MVFLRHILPEDRERILDILTSEKVNQNYMLPDFESREAAIHLFNRLLEMSRDAKKYVCAIATDEGLVGFVNQVEILDQKIELGYAIHPDEQGKGYMTAALQLAMKELFAMGYEQIITGAFSTNVASIRVMEKCGMSRMAHTDQIEYRGATHICVYYRKERI